MRNTRKYFDIRKSEEGVDMPRAELGKIKRRRMKEERDDVAFANAFVKKLKSGKAKLHSEAEVRKVLRR